MKHVVAAVALIVAAVATPRAQSSIAGRIVADDSSQSVRNARVSLNLPNSQEGVVVLSDSEGRFLLPAPEGRHTVAARKTQFALGQVTTVAGGAPVEIRLRRGAAISGRIIDELGDPVIAVRVTVEAAAGGSAGMTVTDDRGEYRIGGLSAGTFRVGVTTLGSPTFRMIPTSPAGSPGGVSLRGFAEPNITKTYYPNGTTPDEGQALELQWGDERVGVDLVLQGARAGLQPFDVNRRGPAIPAPQRPQATRC